MSAKARRSEWQKQKEMAWGRRTGHFRGIGADEKIHEKPSARKHFYHKPYGALTEHKEVDANETEKL